MKTPERFDRATKALVKAFFKDHLAKFSCSACAVGNIVAAGMNIPVDIELDTRADNAHWINLINSGQLFCTDDFFAAYKNYITDRAVITIGEFRHIYDLALKNVSSTGYTLGELYKIENAFESNTKIRFRQYPLHSKQEIMEDQFRGLMAVVDVLCKIEGLDAQPYKKAFEYTEDFQPVNQL